MNTQTKTVTLVMHTQCRHGDKHSTCRPLWGRVCSRRTVFGCSSYRDQTQL